jgi:hypothetical protein
MISPEGKQLAFPYISAGGKRMEHEGFGWPIDDLWAAGYVRINPEDMGITMGKAPTPKQMVLISAYLNQTGARITSLELQGHRPIWSVYRGQRVDQRHAQGIRGVRKLHLCVWRHDSRWVHPGAVK